MAKYNIEHEHPEDMQDGRTNIALTPGELRALYLLRENHVQELVEAAAMLDDGQRRLGVRMLQAMVEHRRSMLS